MLPEAYAGRGGVTDCLEPLQIVSPGWIIKNIRPKLPPIYYKCLACQPFDILKCLPVFMLSKPGIVKSASLDFHQFQSRSKLFNELKAILNESLCMVFPQLDLFTNVAQLQFPEPDDRISALHQIHSLVCSLTRDNTNLSRSVFEATQLDEKLFSKFKRTNIC